MLWNCAKNCWRQSIRGMFGIYKSCQDNLTKVLPRKEFENYRCQTLGKGNSRFTTLLQIRYLPGIPARTFPLEVFIKPCNFGFLRCHAHCHSRTVASFTLSLTETLNSKTRWPDRIDLIVPRACLVPLVARCFIFGQWNRWFQIRWFLRWERKDETV